MLAFERAISELACHPEGNSSGIEKVHKRHINFLLIFKRAISALVWLFKGRSSGIEKVHKRYIDFSNKLCLSEVTSQQQGIELYNMLCEQLMIENLADEIDGQINSFYEAETAKHDKRENRILFWLAIFGVVEVVLNIRELILWFLGKG